MTPSPAETAPGDTSEQTRPAAERRHRRGRWWELPGLILLAVLIAVLVKTFVAQPFYIPSASMERTLHGCTGCHGDRILVSKLSYDVGHVPHAGDIVVFHAPPGWNENTTTPPANPVLRGVRDVGQFLGFVPPDGEILVKRVIAVGGETIRGGADGRVQVSEHGDRGPFRTLDEPFVYVSPADGPQHAFGPVTVPAGRLWVMGDHRNFSEDSRFHCRADGTDDFGDTSQCARYVRQATVPVGDVIGKAVVIAWPPSRWRTLGTPTTFR